MSREQPNDAIEDSYSNRFISRRSTNQIFPRQLLILGGMMTMTTIVAGMTDLAEKGLNVKGENVTNGTKNVIRDGLPKKMPFFSVFLSSEKKTSRLWDDTFDLFKEQPPENKEKREVFLDAMNTRVKQLIGKGDAPAALNLLNDVAKEAKNLGQKEIAAEALVTIARNSSRAQSNGNGKTTLKNIELYVEALELVDSHYPEAAEWADALVKEGLSFEAMRKQKLADIASTVGSDKVEKSISFAELMSGYSTLAALDACKTAESYLLDWYVQEKFNISKSKVPDHTKRIDMRELERKNEDQDKRISQVKNMLAARKTDLNAKVREIVKRVKNGPAADEVANRKSAEVPAQKIVYRLDEFPGIDIAPPDYLDKQVFEAGKEDGNGKVYIDPDYLHTFNLSDKTRREMTQITANIQH